MKTSSEHIDAITSERDALREEVTNLKSKNETLEQQLAWIKRQMFGQKSERLIPQDPKQFSLFETSEAPPAEKTTIKQYERFARKSPTDIDSQSHIRFDDSVPVDETVVLPEEVKDLDESQYKVISDKITDRLVQIPTRYRVKRTIRKTCEILESSKLVTAPAPDAVIERSFADATFLAGMITDKFLYHLPLYRQHQRMNTAGVHISRGHLTKLTHRTLELLEPIYLAILSSVITSDVVSMDETPIKAGRKGKGKMKTAYFWPVFAEDEVAFVYSSSRGHKVVSEVLGSGCKKLMSDGYSAYESYAASRVDLVHWSHVRRKFFEAKDYSPVECQRVLTMIAKLFSVEKQKDELLFTRRIESLPVVDEFFEYLNQLWFEQVVDKTSLLGKAISYTIKREKELKQFLIHEDIPLSNNHVERVIRPVALGRKNWMFCSYRAARHF